MAPVSLRMGDGGLEIEILKGGLGYVQSPLFIFIVPLVCCKHYWFFMLVIVMDWIV